jgi:hypothetical protein
MVKKLLSFAAAILVGTIAAAPVDAASGYDVSDLWWTPSESGWGIQLVQGHDTVFATLLVYDAAGGPVWYSGVLNFEGLTPNTHQPNYAGDLYGTSGPWFGALVYDPATAVSRRVGTMQFRATTLTSATLTYSIDGLTVTKTIVRMTLRLDDYAGDYAISTVITTSKCDNPTDDGTRVTQGTMTIAQTTATMTIAVIAGGDSCTYSGPFTQDGRLGSVFSNFDCASGQAGALVFQEMVVQRFAVAGRLFGADNRGCRIEGQFAAVRL